MSENNQAKLDHIVSKRDELFRWAKILSYIYIIFILVVIFSGFVSLYLQTPGFRINNGFWDTVLIYTFSFLTIILFIIDLLCFIYRRFSIPIIISFLLSLLIFWWFGLFPRGILLMNF